MRVEDSLARGVSYFMAELQRLKQIVDAARQLQHEGSRRLFYLLDEILQGTNTAERQIAARQVIMYLVKTGRFGAVSTHDLTLAHCAGHGRGRSAGPLHRDDPRRGRAQRGRAADDFDYKLRPGLATSTNALKLMQIVGLDFDE